MTVAVVVGIMVIKVLSRFFNQEGILIFLGKFDTNSFLSNTIAVGIAIISLIGLFKSFGGTILDKSYTGPILAWGGIGSWSVIFLITITFIFGSYLKRFEFGLLSIFIVDLVFFPSIFCGSRIDFLSFNIAILVSIFCFSNKKLFVRLLYAAVLILWTIFVCYLIGKLRYLATEPDSLSNLINVLSQSFVDNKEMLYLSTIGDLGASVFQVVGLINKDNLSYVGIDIFFHDYFIRLIPNLILDNRPRDFASLAPENLGGGALHSFGEGYLISGFIGSLFVSSFFGLLGAFSGLMAQHLKKNFSALGWMIFAFPWIVLVRGGWYQFFATFKSFEILILFVLILSLAIFFRKRIFTFVD